MTTNQQQSSKITWSYVCAVIGIFIVPIVLGPVAWFLAHSAGKEGDTRAGTAKTFAIIATIVGIALSAFVLLGQ